MSPIKPIEVFISMQSLFLFHGSKLKQQRFRITFNVLHSSTWWHTAAGALTQRCFEDIASFWLFSYVTAQVQTAFHQEIFHKAMVHGSLSGLGRTENFGCSNHINFSQYL